MERMFTPENVATTMVNALRNCRKTSASKQPARFTRRECCVTQALLSGQNVSHVARVMGKDIRTISAYKQSVLDKMKMVHSGELQVLGGNLMAAEVKQREGME
ncbi:response regulator transcription factor [Enterobacillus tribolii]|nr:response regulator transcription factor [Enterobacillus tribolii]